MVGPFRLAGDLHTLTSRLEAGDVSAVNELAPALPAATSYHQCKITSCADDPEFTLLSLEAVSRTTDNKGKEQVTTRTRLRHLFITPAMRKAIEAKAAEPVAPAAAKPAVEST